jgi:hypothetical protein
MLVWNRLRFVKDPSTGKRFSRPNPQSEWIRTDVPHLRIVDDELWNAVRARQQQISTIFGPNEANTREGRMKRLHLANRPGALLSGLSHLRMLRRQIYGIILPNRYGCLNHHRRATCDNNRTITCAKIEARVLAGLKERLVSSEAVAEAARSYGEEMNRLSRDRRVEAQSDEKALAKVERAIAGILSAIEDGMYQPSMKARMDELEQQKAEISRRLSKATATIPEVHPNIADNYRRWVERFAEALQDPDGGRQAAEALRSLIGEIVLMPGKKRGQVHATLRGELMCILGLANARERGDSDALFMPAVAASPRNHFYRTLDIIIQLALLRWKSNELQDVAAQIGHGFSILPSHIDTLDQAPQDLDRLRACLVVIERGLQGVNLLAVCLCQVRMKQWPSGRRRIELGLQRRTLLFHSDKPRLQALGPQAVGDCVVETFDLLLDVGERPSNLGIDRAPVAFDAVHLLMKCADKLGHQIGRHQAVLEAAEDGRFQLLSTNALLDAATRFQAGRSTGEVVAADRCQRTATGMAERNAGEQMARTPLLPKCMFADFDGKWRLPDAFKTDLNIVPQIRTDDAQLGDVLPDPQGLRVCPRYPIACSGVADIALPVPDENTLIEVVA